ncbi:glycosyltransferase [Streptomyces sp. NPDC058864]
MAKILVTTTPHIGHVTPLAAIAADLTRRGHEVLFYTGSRFEEQVRGTGARFAPYPPEVDHADFTAAFPERDTLGPFDRMVFDIKHVLSDPVPVHDAHLRHLLAEFPATAVISEVTSYYVLPMALRAPRGRRPLMVHVGIAPPTFDSVDTAPFGPGLPPPATDAERARYDEMRTRTRETFADAQRHVEDVFASTGVTFPDFLFNAIGTVPDLVLQLTAPAFEYPRSDAPPGFRFIGPLPPAPADGFERPEWWADLSSGRPVVVVTQGTLGNADLSELVVPTLRALADADVTVVAATARPDGPEAVRAAMDGAVPDNARLAGFVPFDELLPLADVLVTNAGYGGVHTALHHGVPLVVGGDTEDKPEVAARVEWSGTGVDLRTGRPRPEAVRTAVRTVLGEPRYRERVDEIRRQFAEYRPFDVIDEIVRSA